jgi:ribosomal protein S12 methylthiotransferase accessory factor
MADTQVLNRIESLVSPFGVVADVGVLRTPRGLSGIAACMAVSDFLPPPDMPDASQFSHRTRDRIKSGTSGQGTAFDDADAARLIAIAEAAERYSASDFQQPVVWAAYRELDGPALESWRIPRCSARELAAPNCPLTAPDPDARIRWVRGTDLASGATMWVPAVMAFYGLRASPAERFWYQISTGFAVHADPEEALVRGICEVIERDALTITWLQQLPLPVVADGCLSDLAQRLLDWARRHFIDTYLFDATTDVGIPAVFCLQVAPHDKQRAQFVSSATGRSISAAADKALLEACQARSHELCDEDPPASILDFRSFTDGSRYMGTPDRVTAFGFLINGARGRVAAERETLPADSIEFLSRLIASLSAKGMQMVAVDRTTRELADAGLTAANIIVPELQPMSLLPRAQYRAHARLYSAPVLMGYPSLTEEELNPWPIPYA